jgi:probable HAF family extracellular repeat protein
LGTLPGGTSSAAGAINAAGVVAGFSQTLDGTERAVLWIPTGSGSFSIRDLGTLGGTRSAASGINTAAEVAGWSTTPDGLTHAVVWTPSALSGSWKITDLGTLPGGVGEFGQAINDAEQVLGYSETTDTSTEALVWTPAGSGTFDVTNLRGFPGGNGFVSGNGIDDAGQVAGYSNQNPSDSHAVHAAMWSRTKLGAFTITDLGPLPGGISSQAWGISPAGGQVVGTSDTSSLNRAEHAVVWRTTG